MYQALLTRKYFLSKVMPLLSALAVLLCAMMVLLVWSIMGGFLDVILTTGRSLTGDVAISWPTAGFRYYEDLIKRLEADPAIAAATPVIDAPGMIGLPDGRAEGVLIKGIDGPSYARATEYEQTLWWKPISKPLPKDDKDRLDPRLTPQRDWARYLEDGKRLMELDPVLGRDVPAVVLGTEVSGFNERLPSGVYRPSGAGSRQADGAVSWASGFMPDKSVSITVFPMGNEGRPSDVRTRTFPVANEFKSGLYELDSRTVLVELNQLQQLLKMDAAPRIAPPSPSDRYRIVSGPAGGEQGFSQPRIIGMDPARVTTVLVRAKPGVPLADADARCKAIYTEFAAAHPGEVPDPPVRGVSGRILIQTSEERQGTLVSAVQKEIVMVIGIVMVVSFVASFMILSIFWAMISEKTKDIGVLRAIGAGRSGIAGLWLGYGLSIGVIGSLIGVLSASLIVWNINPIHEWLGRRLGIQVWDPKIYYLVDIPNHVVGWKVLVVIAGGIVFSVLGALIPAVRAARMDPVQALRFE